MVVSSTSMKVGTITAAATNQGLIAGRLTAGTGSATLLMVRGQESACRVGGPFGTHLSCIWWVPKTPPTLLFSWLGFRGPCRQRGDRLQPSAGVRPPGRFLVVNVRFDRQADE